MMQFFWVHTEEKGANVLMVIIFFFAAVEICALLSGVLKNLAMKSEEKVDEEHIHFVKYFNRMQVEEM
jgi:hypothetical protein